MPATLQIGNELQLCNASYQKRLGLRVLDGGSDTVDLQLVRYDTSGQEAETILTIDGGTGIVAIATANLDLPAGSVVTADLADAAVTPVKLANGVRVVANDGAVVIAATDKFIRISKTANTTTAITMTATHAGHEVVIEMTAGDADSVYTAAVTGGTVTFNAALERCRFIYDGSAWIHQIETGATFA